MSSKELFVEMFNHIRQNQYSSLFSVDMDREERKVYITLPEMGTCKMKRFCFRLHQDEVIIEDKGRVLENQVDCLNHFVDYARKSRSNSNAFAGIFIPN